MAVQNKGAIGQFIPTTQIRSTRELFDFANNVSVILNTKDSGWYVQEEFMNGQVFFPDPSTRNQNNTEIFYRQVFRKVINFGTLPNNATKRVAHNIDITDNVTFTRIYGTANDPASHIYRPLPYVGDSSSENIELNVDGSDVIVRTGGNQTAYTIVYIILEYLKQ